MRPDVRRDQADAECAHDLGARPQPHDGQARQNRGEGVHRQNVPNTDINARGQTDQNYRNPRRQTLRRARVRGADRYHGAESGESHECQRSLHQQHHRKEVPPTVPAYMAEQIGIVSIHAVLKGFADTLQNFAQREGHFQETVNQRVEPSVLTDILIQQQKLAPRHHRLAGCTSAGSSGASATPEARPAWRGEKQSWRTWRGSPKPQRRLPGRRAFDRGTRGPPASSKTPGGGTRPTRNPWWPYRHVPTPRG